MKKFSVRVLSVVLTLMLLVGFMPVASVLAAAPEEGYAVQAEPKKAQTPLITSFGVKFNGKKYPAKISGLGKEYSPDTLFQLERGSLSIELPDNVKIENVFKKGTFYFTVSGARSDYTLHSDNEVYAKSTDKTFKMPKSFYAVQKDEKGKKIPFSRTGFNFYLGSRKQLNQKRTQFYVSLYHKSNAGAAWIDDLSIVDEKNSWYYSSNGAQCTQTTKGDVTNFDFKTLSYNAPGSLYGIDFYDFENPNYNLTAVYEGHAVTGVDLLPQGSSKIHNLAAWKPFLLVYEQDGNPAITVQKKIQVRATPKKNDSTNLTFNGFYEKYDATQNNEWSRFQDYVSMDILGSDSNARTTNAFDAKTRDDRYLNFVVDKPSVNVKKLFPKFTVPHGATVRVNNKVYQEGMLVNWSKPVKVVVTSETKKKQTYTFDVTKKVNNKAKLVVAGGKSRSINMNEWGRNSHFVQVMNIGTKKLTGMKAKLSDTSNFVIDEYYSLGGSGNTTLQPYGDYVKGATPTTDEKYRYGNDWFTGGVLILPKATTKTGKYTLTLTVQGKGSGNKVTQKLTINYKKDKGFKVSVDDVVLNKGDTVLKKGKSLKVTGIVSPSNASNQTVKWSSSKPSVATVDQTGRIKAVKNGKTVITASAGGVKKKITIYVGTKVTKVTTSKTLALTLPADPNAAMPTAKLAYKVLPAKAANKAVTFISSDPSIATVSDKGVITAKKAGTVRITVQAIDGNKKASCVVTISAPAAS